MALSVTGGSFLNSAPAEIFTVESFGPDDRMMIDTAEAFSRNEVLTRSAEIETQAEGVMPKLIREAGELGLCGLDSPEEYGGLGQSKNLAARVLEFMSLDASFSVTYGITSGISQVGLALFGNDSQKRRYLPRLTSGEWIGAYALSEPDSGSDALSATCRADYRNGRFVLNGTKMWISNAKWANLFLVMAKIDGDKFSAFLVERDSPGLSIGREEHKMGLKGSSTARLVLDDAVIPEENLLYEAGKGHHVAFNALNLGRFKLSSMSLGPARRAIEVATEYSQQRKQFGKVIGSFELIQAKFALMHALFFVAESMTYRTGANIDAAFSQHGETLEGNRLAAEEFSIECSACKVFSTEAESIIVDEALQVFGGYGFTEDFPIARIYRDARVSRIYEGTNEINRLFIADRVQKRIKEGRLSPLVRVEGFISELLTEAIQAPGTGQSAMGALSDLIILAYAEQSSRIRAKMNPHLFEASLEVASGWMDLKAAAAYQTLTGKSVTIPAPRGGPSWV